MLLIIWTAVLAVTLTIYLRRVYTKLSSHGVHTLKTYPIVGNMHGLLMGKKHFVNEFEDLYFKFPEDRFVGRYEFLNPIVIAKDLELIKNITFKDFEYFLDHRTFTDEKKEPIFARNLFSLRGREWKEMRSTLTPAFTSSKIKGMVPFMNEVSKQMLKVLEKNIEDAGGALDVDVKDLTTRFATDVIASCAFGLKVNSHKEVNNTFYEMGKSVATFNFKHLFMFIFYGSFPAIVKRLNLTMFTEAAKNFFTDLVLNTIRNREAKNITRPDMINLLMLAKKGQLSYDDQSYKNSLKDDAFSTPKEVPVGKKNEMKDEDLVAQAVIFLIAGFETVASTMSFCLHELAMNPEVQEKLVQEIREFDVKNNGKIDYSSIQNMPYLDMFVSEVLRLWPPVGALDRVCVKDYNMGKAHDKAPRDYIIRKGECLSITSWTIHRDPKYYPNPEKFDPERFSEENKHKINPFTYMPFGLGPRSCIGSRFALCKIKVFLYEALLRVKVCPSEKLRLPIRFARDTFNLTVDGGFWIKFKVRN